MSIQDLYGITEEREQRRREEREERKVRALEDIAQQLRRFFTNTKPRQLCEHHLIQYTRLNGYNVNAEESDPKDWDCEWCSRDKGEETP